MTWFVGKLLSILSGPFLAKVFSWLEQRERVRGLKHNAQKEVILQAILSDARKTEAVQKYSTQRYLESRLYRITIFLFSFPYILYIWSVILVSVFPVYFEGWTVKQIPDHVWQPSGMVLAFYFGSTAVYRIVDAFVRR